MSEMERRAYVRHPIDAPVHIYPQYQLDVKMRDIGHGGVAFQSNVELSAGTLLIVVIPHLQPVFEETCTVCWSKPSGDGFEIGARFLDQDALFRVRLVEQVCHIEAYHQQALQDGRNLSLEQSAREWVAKYAAEFAQSEHA